MPKVSVIVPAYNCETYIRNTIDSIRTQTERDIEIVIIDDGSTDKSLAIIEEMAANDLRIQVFSQANSGKPAAARNVGLEKAKGRFVCFLDGDDLYHPEKIANEVAFLEAHPDIAAVFHDMMYIAADGTEFPMSYLKEVNFLERAGTYLQQIGERQFLLSDQFFHFMSLYFAAAHTSSLMLRHSDISELKIRFPEDVTVGEDTEVWWQVAYRRKLGYIDRVLSYYRQHEASVTRNRQRYFEDLIAVHSRNFFRIENDLSGDERGVYRCRIANMWTSLAYLYRLEGALDKARQSYAQTMVWGKWAGGIYGYAKTYIISVLNLWYGRDQGQSS